MQHALRRPHGANGIGSSRSPRRQRNQALLRGRCRLLLFLLLVVAAWLLGPPAAPVAAVVGVVLGILSINVARRRGQGLAHTFVVLDWLLLGSVLALTGGVHSWLLAAVPLLTAGHLGASPRQEWPYLLAPSLVMLIILAIADPALGGSQALSVVTVLLLVTGGAIAAHRVTLQRNRRTHPPRIDAVSGFPSVERLPAIAAVRLRVAAAEGSSLSLVYLHLQDYEDSRNFLDKRACEALVREVARRLQAQLQDGDLAFRLPPDAFALILPGRAVAEARDLANRAAHEVSGSLIAGRRQMLATGVASFPAVASFDELLAAARYNARPARPDLQAARQVGRLATAR